MPQQDTREIKEKIKNFIRNHGPSLPIHLSKEINRDTIFTSAFLSELLSEREIKTSHMKVGSSALYFLPGQEQKLENFSQYLKSKEKEAFELLKQRKFLKDSEQEPAIRVALRAIKDFAIPFNKNKEIIWRYFAVPESEHKEEKIKEEIQEIKKEKSLEIKQKTLEEKKEEKEKELDIFEKENKEKQNKELENKKRKKTKKQNTKKNEKFFNKIKEYLSEKNIEILDIEAFNRNDLILKIKENEKQELLFAYNKKRVNEQDIIKASKKASEENLSYKVISLGEPLKRLQNLIQAVKNLSNIESVK